MNVKIEFVRKYKYIYDKIKCLLKYNNINYVKSEFLLELRR